MHIIVTTKVYQFLVAPTTVLNYYSHSTEEKICFIFWGLYCIQGQKEENDIPKWILHFRFSLRYAHSMLNRETVLHHKEILT